MDRGQLSDSPWTLIAGFAKAFTLPIDVVLYDMSFANVILYSATLPTHNSSVDDRGRGAKKHIKINASDPKNREKVEKILSI